MTKPLIITIDGPNAVGKTDAARALARLLGYRHVNTGAIYRAVAYVSLARGCRGETSAPSCRSPGRSRSPSRRRAPPSW